MSWQPEIDELEKRKRLAEAMGGSDKLKRQRDAGRLNVRERIAAVADPGSFHEIGQIAGFAQYDDEGGIAAFQPSNFLFGRARIDGRPVVLTADDFTVRGGAADAAIHRKLVEAEKLANEYRLPLVRMIEGTGGGGSVRTLESMGHTYVPELPGWETMVDNLSCVPVVSLGLGPVAGLGAGRMVMSHYSLLVEGVSQMFVAGPPVVAAVGEMRTKEELGGAAIHAANGAVDDVASSEAHAFALMRSFLSYLPTSVDELAGRVPTGDDPSRRDEGLIDAIPRNPRHLYHVRPIVETVVDRGSFFEIGRNWGKGVVTGFARLDGWPVALMASDPYHYGGAWTADTCQKVERFVDTAQTFHLPIVYLVDCPGFLIGLEAEKTGTIKQGVRAMSAIWQSSVPWCAVIIRNVFGVAGAAHRNGAQYCTRYAWPSGRWGSLPLEGGIEAAYRAEIDAAPDPKDKMVEIEERLTKLRSPFRSAETFWIEEIIDPRDTRPLICDFATLAAPLRRPGPSSHAMRP